MIVVYTTDMLGDEVIDLVAGEIIDQKDLAGRRRFCRANPPRKLLGNTLEAELTKHLVHEHRGALAGANVRNGTRVKTVLTEIEPVEAGGSEVPRWVTHTGFG